MNQDNKNDIPFGLCVLSIVSKMSFIGWLGLRDFLLSATNFRKKSADFLLMILKHSMPTLIFFHGFLGEVGDRIPKTHGTDRYSTNHCGKTGSNMNFSNPSEVVLNRSSRAFIKTDRSFGCKQFASRLKPHFTTFSIVYKIASCYNWMSETKINMD